ncbi:methionine ABC transporter ATP-binding protein [Lutispora saccharofermentans]|uniref:Methionine ABC transporter ATP-binding protein n=1 Tax=Lutispora saccharofermentans TaxID=3024236 RepID=A0ABT1NNL2_9FIRM|nr:methionine ABC transporter ATP-binding protein [Lutispora saccharofermentans]MCQ1531693.1 methionine ABC transporter ATP-binding protein [Lutispora saccharofermentans]
MIDIKGLYKTYTGKEGNTEALKNINLRIEKGDIFGIIGLSGAGKSTLIRCINRLEEPTKGSVFIEDKDIVKLNDGELRDMRRNIGMIFQHFNLLSRKNCRENIAFPLKIMKYDKREMEKRVDELLDIVDLKDKKLSYPSQLSGGQKQRVAIARALATNPKILLCDEATSALDPNTTSSILKLLKSINETLGITIVMITHQMEVIKEVCNKVAVISDGSIVEQGNTYDVFSKPSHPITKSFIKDVSLNIDRNIIDDPENTEVVRITFLDHKAKEPLIYKIIKNFDIEANILAGQMNSIQGRTYGNLVVGLRGTDEKIEAAIGYLKDEGIIVEELKYNGSSN